jgi:hypothetical protein
LCAGSFIVPQDQKRKKIEALRDREAKQDRRAKLEELLVVKLCNKYGRTTDMCGTIAGIVSSSTLTLDIAMRVEAIFVKHICSAQAVLR